MKADDRCPFNKQEKTGEKKTSAVNRQGYDFFGYRFVRGEGVVVPDTNLFDLTEAVNLSRRPAREPDGVNLFLLGFIWDRICRHGCIVFDSTKVHDRRSGERWVATSC